jgi:ferrous iron transport protein B
MIAPLMTCSARLPVYALLIGAFIPAIKPCGGFFNLQGLVMFSSLLWQAFASAMAVAGGFQTPGAADARPTPLMMELPAYRMAEPAQSGYGAV